MSKLERGFDLYRLLLEWQGMSCFRLFSSIWSIWLKDPSSSCTVTLMGPCTHQKTLTDSSQAWPDKDKEDWSLRKSWLQVTQTCFYTTMMRLFTFLRVCARLGTLSLLCLERQPSASAVLVWSTHTHTHSTCCVSMLTTYFWVPDDV